MRKLLPFLMALLVAPSLSEALSIDGVYLTGPSGEQYSGSFTHVIVKRDFSMEGSARYFKSDGRGAVWDYGMNQQFYFSESKMWLVEDGYRKYHDHSTFHVAAGGKVSLDGVPVLKAIPFFTPFRFPIVASGSYGGRIEFAPVADGHEEREDHGTLRVTIRASDRATMLWGLFPMGKVGLNLIYERLFFGPNARTDYRFQGKYQWGGIYVAGRWDLVRYTETKGLSFGVAF